MHVIGSACTLSRYHHVQSSSSLRKESFKSNVDGTFHNHKPKCVWNLSNASCSSASSNTTENNTSTARFECECPYGPDPYPDVPPDLLPDWIGTLFYNNHSMCRTFSTSTRIVDWSWPGTHDSLSYDLSLIVSDDGIDQMEWLADLFHNSKISFEHGELQDFIRVQAKTQQLTITQQLDNGIRFLDLRMMYEEGQKEWYSLHCLQSNQPIATYWQHIRDWLDAHPHELVILWLSRHGNPYATGEDQYPQVPRTAKQAIWDTYRNIMDGLLVNTTTFPHPLNETTISDLIHANMRVVTLVSDYEEFTGSSPLALDAARTLQNKWDATGGMFDKSTTLETHCHYMADAAENNAAVSHKGGLTLLAMNTAASKWPVIVAAQERFLGWTVPFAKHKCKIPDTAWCPESVLDMAQLASYYNQIVLNTSLSTPHTAFPHAFYLDALDYNGTIRTGSQLLDGTQRDDTGSSQRFAYVDTLLQYNMAQSQCGDDDLPASMRARLQAYPAQFWDEPSRGRTAVVPQCDPRTKNRIQASDLDSLPKTT